MELERRRHPSERILSVKVRMLRHTSSAALLQRCGCGDRCTLTAVLPIVCAWKLQKHEWPKRNATGEFGGKMCPFKKRNRQLWLRLRLKVSSRRTDNKAEHYCAMHGNPSAAPRKSRGLRFFWVILYIGIVRLEKRIIGTFGIGKLITL